MTHILDNPIYHALISAHRGFSDGNETVRFYQEDIASFAGLKDNSAADFENLAANSGEDALFIVFSPVKLQIPKPWHQVAFIDMFQLVYESPIAPIAPTMGLNDLDESHVSAMLALTELTKPGPFRQKTIDLGNYTGILKNGELLAMAGHRFNPTPYTEVSAVCTHPEHLGRGYGYQLLLEQVKRILAKGEIPFLHVRNDNEGAIKLYQKVGFKIRIPMLAYVLKKHILS